MKKLLPLIFSAGLATAGAQTYTSTGLNGVDLGLTAGYAGGLSGEVFVHAPNVAGPVGVKVGVSYTRPSNPINTSEAANFGFPTENLSQSGSNIIAGLDATYSLGQVAPGVGATLYGGGRYGMFNARLTAEDGRSTAFSSSAFGLGTGIMADYALTSNLSLVGDLGIDYFFNSTANYTSYDANGNPTQCVEGQTTCQLAAANNGIFNRPGTVFKARVGLKTSF